MSIVIETKNLTKYYGNTLGIVDISLQIKKGEIFGFIGPNGAGKSTTIRTLLNFIFPTSGFATILGMDIVKDTKQIKKHVGYLAGEIDYYDDMTVNELLDYSARFYELGATKRIEELSDIFELNLRKKIKTLSLGNKKKVGIIQALLHNPKLLILDEPTSGLDPLMQKRFFEVLKEENEKGTTIFFSSHVLNEVQKFCERVAIIKNGVILQIERVEELRKGEFRKVFINFKNNETVPHLDIEGIINSYYDNHSLRLFYNGDINDLVRALSQYNLESLWLEEPTLEEVFMHYYEVEENYESPSS
ncbi:Efflux ABC transporter, ATP-binding protein [Candidatus Syntrophocurvum alkaliphilum]|uniref:Efflux ABC transporter, ATP-binding protein n=1 Tax=Candidatus Syntrophocurvum alkaliphilum TaxID=2293317 RepID=A0A6I6D7L1_9FIRM|nr:ABC transporter ATP-binding protein [Candidatus Syntrophocurvum alkaliphilum]QGT98637.1 Efflux ABC transporter, ATP-binding protein [Candidatus Syntrophocurvum alkaliphilum]